MTEYLNQWVNAVANGDVAAVLALYGPSSTLHPTLQAGIHRHGGHISIKGYFDYFLAKPVVVTVSEVTQGDSFCVGCYEVKRGDDTVQARFTFIYDEQGLIVHHHSSVMPV